MRGLLIPIVHTSSEESEQLHRLIDQNEKFLLRFTDLLFERDKDVKNRLLDCKIKVSEKEILINEKKMAFESWQRRINQCYKNSVS